MLAWSLIGAMFDAGAKSPAAAFGNLATLIKGRGGRSFSVDRDGAWINKQPRATFVSPDIHALRYDDVKRTVLDYWCHTYTPKAGDVVFDIGAGIGDEAVIFSHMAGEVYSVEAHPDTFAHLAKTVERSGLTNVTPLQIAIGGSDGVLSISNDQHHLANSVLVGGDTTVSARSLASLCAELGISRIDLLKTNIEGAERFAIEGFGDLDIRHLAIACHDFMGVTTKDAVRDFLASAGYQVTERPEHHLPWVRDTIYADQA